MPSLLRLNCQLNEKRLVLTVSKDESILLAIVANSYRVNRQVGNEIKAQMFVARTDHYSADKYEHTALRYSIREPQQKQLHIAARMNGQWPRIMNILRRHRTAVPWLLSFCWAASTHGTCTRRIYADSWTIWLESNSKPKGKGLGMGSGRTHFHNYATPAAASVIHRRCQTKPVTAVILPDRCAAARSKK